jgi:hypothetical protein
MTRSSLPFFRSARSPQTLAEVWSRSGLRVILPFVTKLKLIGKVGVQRFSAFHRWPIPFSPRPPAKFHRSIAIAELYVAV